MQQSRGPDHKRLRTVPSLLVQEEEQRVARQRLGTALLQALAHPPSADAEDQWRFGEHGDAVIHLESFAKGDMNAPHGQALFALIDAGCTITADGAAHLLKRLGVWPARMPNAVVRVAMHVTRLCVRQRLHLLFMLLCALAAATCKLCKLFEYLVNDSKDQCLPVMHVGLLQWHYKAAAQVTVLSTCSCAARWLLTTHHKRSKKPWH